MFETNVTVVGRVVSPVDHRVLESGVARAGFRIGCTERRRDKVTGDWVDGETLYLSITCWRVLAENVKASLGVGDPVVVRGRMYTRRYETEGRPVSVVEMEAMAVGPDLARCTTVVSRVRSGAASARAAEAVAAAVAEVPAGPGSSEAGLTGADPTESGWERELVSAGAGAEAAHAR